MVEDRRVIGVDESGKGDFFGPLVIAGFLAADSEKPGLVSLGVRDSKKISNGRVREIARHLRSQFPHAFFVLEPTDYNRQYQATRNLNKLLAGGHAHVIHAISDKNAVDLAISDQFGHIDRISGNLEKLGSSTRSMSVVRGEQIIQVAAASILARADFLERIDRMSEELGITLPRGAGPPVDKAGQEIVDRLGPEILSKIAKVHFKNYLRVINPRLL